MARALCRRRGGNAASTNGAFYGCEDPRRSAALPDELDERVRLDLHANMTRIHRCKSMRS
jgi:hypothetical protein